MAMTKAITRIQIPAKSGLDTAEQLIARIAEEQFDSEVVALLPTTFRRDIFADVWAAIALGTLCRARPDTAAIARGVSNRSTFSDKTFTTTPPGLVATFLANEVRAETSSPTLLDTGPAKTWIEYDCQGLLLGEEEGAGATRTLVEFSDHRALALTALRPPSRRKGALSESVFNQLVLNARMQLEFWDKKGDDPFGPLSTGPMACLSEFLRELFENANQHGRNARSDKQLRFLRFRKIIDGRDRLIQRAGSHFPALAHHVENVLENDDTDGFLEVTVSDFGHGILGHFLSSPAGKKYAAAKPRDVMQRLLYGNLSSKSQDTAAGQGIVNALTAAQRLGAFVSLRTADSWFAKSYSTDPQTFMLEHVASEQLAPAAGTHWQLLWKIPR
ncbi:MAG: hypothetical protein ABMA14_16865 [Hyphomonadaceae bacterium]